ncbi:hypothetical protein [Nocardioides sp. TF02-7]|uniref:hypothetical protein n=1 Tax=Nocardioides sp. TF02-7 TaxID=2917724 RepID=UPI001F05E0B8|nr:hypothetical protein [Nocardioides sp. TF02-7]UMG91879.1 hypothetical protein MF408_17880 [Nocardioides sp. TF02-7]
MTSDETSTDRVDLYWIPLGADGSPLVRWSGTAYEAVCAAAGRRPRRRLFHSALKVHLDGATHVIEVGPEWGRTEADRGVVSGGPVGHRLLGRSRLFRYEVRCWRGGVLPDEAHAVESPTLVGDRACARAVLRLVRDVPTHVWGRDELQVGDMWNSNSVVAWLLARAGADAAEPPQGGRAPGWAAGLELARRQASVASGAGRWGHPPP